MHSLRVARAASLVFLILALTACNRDRTGGGLGIDPRIFMDGGSATCAEACTSLRRLEAHPSCVELGFEVPPDCESECESEMIDPATRACVAGAVDCSELLMCLDTGTECPCDSSSGCDEGCSCDSDCDDIPPPPPVDAGTGVDSGPGVDAGCECNLIAGTCDEACSCDPDCAGSGLCTNDCMYHDDGECDDGGDGSLTSLCELGTDCNDCGIRFAG